MPFPISKHDPLLPVMLVACRDGEVELEWQASCSTKPAEGR